MGHVEIEKGWWWWGKKNESNPNKIPLHRKLSSISAPMSVFSHWLSPLRRRALAPGVAPQGRGAWTSVLLLVFCFFHQPPKRGPPQRDRSIRRIFMVFAVGLDMCHCLQSGIYFFSRGPEQMEDAWGCRVILNKTS